MAKDALQSAGFSCRANSVVLVGAAHDLGSTAIIGAHLGLLFWETRYVSLQLAAPGLRPHTPIPTGEE